MNPDECDFFAHASKPPRRTVALDLIKGLQQRASTNLDQNAKSRKNLDLFAEDQLVRKEFYDEMRCEMPGQPRSTFLMVFSPDGTKVASTHGNHNIYVTDLKSGKNIKTLEGHPRTPWCIAFHPTCNQIVASGCLGGEVRIWDLSGGSEVWTTGNQSVIASIAFHPNDRVLVIATYNELYFWDWSKPEPFVQIATSNPKEKVRYVAFDKLGHKLITGIANSPQTRWERVRAPVPVPRQAERSASPYRLRITPRLVNNNDRNNSASNLRNESSSTPETPQSLYSNVPERERRITASYRNLLREYEQLVQRYLKVYRPPRMIDVGTDPMEPNATTSGTQVPEPSTSSSIDANSEEPQPSTSRQQNRTNLVMPSRILAMSKTGGSTSAGNSTQTSDSRKHKSSDDANGSSQEKRVKCDNSCNTESATQTQSPRKVLVINTKSEPSTSSADNQNAARTQPQQGVKITCPNNRTRAPNDAQTRDEPSTSSGLAHVDDLTNPSGLLSNIRPIAEEMRNRLLPIIQSLPACDRPKLIRRFENNRHERMRFRQMCPPIIKKPNRRPVFDTSSDSSSTDDEPTPTNQNTSNNSNNQSTLSARLPETSGSSNQNQSPATNINDVKHFVMQLEQLLMTVLLAEVEGGESNLTGDDTGTQNSNQLAESSSAFRVTSPVTTSRFEHLIRPHVLSSSTPATTAPSSTTNSGTNTRTSFAQLLQPLLGSSSSSTVPVTTVSTSTSSRTSPPVYTRSLYPRRRSASRLSAFIPTRVNYNRATSSRYRRMSYRIGSRLPSTSFVLDELINYSERTTSEDEPLSTNDNTFTNAVINPDGPQESGLNAMYSNIVQDLESSLNDVRNIRASIRPGETSDMLSSFSVSLENIMNQSDTILRNLSGSPSPTTTGGATTNEPRATFNDHNFYVRDNNNGNDRSVIESDHNYPRHQTVSPSNVGGATGSGGDGNTMTPLMTSLHLTISYIQRQAGLLRQQVESIERIDRAMFEVEQLQWIRQLILEQLRYVRSLGGESRSAGLSSVRQMMAGTRISDSSPYDSQSEDTTTPSPQQHNQQTQVGQSGGDSQVPTTSSSGAQQSQQRPTGRTNGRKTYPPSRLFRLQRHYRRSNLVNIFPRRYERGQNRSAPTRTQMNRQESLRRPVTFIAITPMTLNTFSRRLENLLTEHTRLLTREHEPFHRFSRRLENLLSEQTRLLARQNGESVPNNPNRSDASSNDFLERIIPIRLHDCMLRMNRVVGGGLDPDRLLRANNPRWVPVTRDGSTRSEARHYLSMIMDALSTHLDENGATTAGNNMPHSVRAQIVSVLAMALLLSDLLLLQLVDSIPPPAGMDLDVERESLTSRIDQMCSQMLQNRFSSHSLQLTRNLQHMRLIMRHAYRALGQTYNARRNAILPNRQENNRRQLLNRYLRNVNRRRTNQNAPTEASTNNNQGPSTSSGNLPTSSIAGERMSGVWLQDLIMRYSCPTNEDEESNSTPPTTATPSNNNNNNTSTTSEETNRSSPRVDTNVSSNNSDDNDNDDDNEWYLNNNARNVTLYRTNNVNLVNDVVPPPTTSLTPSTMVSTMTATIGGVGTGASTSSSSSASAIASGMALGPSIYRPWNVPSVQVNDVPISDQASVFHQRILSHRHRLAERVSELRSLPQMSVLRPRFLHPLYASVNPFDGDLDDPQRETTYDCDMIATPNHRIQMWDISGGHIPSIANPMKNIIVSECKIHNDASVDIAKDGSILVTLLPSGGYLNITNKLGVYSLKWGTLGQCLYTTSFEQNAVSVALSPQSRHLVVGLASRRVSIVPSDRWTMARIFIIDQKDTPGDRLPIIRELGQSRDSRATNYKSVNCIRWLPTSGQGLIYATNTGQLVLLT